MENLSDKELEFLRGLTELTRKTGIEIAGCGCCGSPFLMDADNPNDFESGYVISDKIEWISKKDRNFDKLKDKIIK